MCVLGVRVDGSDCGVCVCVCVCVRASVRAGTCVAYAFTLALQEDVDAKFGIAVNPAALVEKT